MEPGQDQQERVVVLGDEPPDGALWRPAVGANVRSLGRLLLETGELPPDAFEPVRDAALRVLSQAAPPTGDEARRTGLVVGHVQSGKTLSMTAVAALARDNGFRIVIVFAGVTKILLTQSRDRFQRYLQPPGQYPIQWRMLDSEKPRDLRRAGQQLVGLARDWLNPDIPEPHKPSLFITVMKNHRHLDALADLLSAADLGGMPALIIDDEADQAGLNTSPRSGTVSSTHRHIAMIRDLLPHHTYLQYTATPQAPLLITLIDMLSPQFAEVLEPGEDYTGGEEFFLGDRRLARPLPAGELFKPNDPPDEPPPMLEAALQQFLIVATCFALECPEDPSAQGPWSMLVHPSHRQDDHRAYLRWVQCFLAQWQRDLDLPDDDPDKRALIDDFEAAYDEIRGTDGLIPDLERVVSELRYLVGNTIVTELNSESGDEVRWDNGFAHVLVGGEKLNRGFTVKGLCITYMPRGPGVWNADTIQQRARFFGYRSRYLDRCRLHLHPDVLTAYRLYVDHETDVRRRLVQERGRPLSEWKRAFFLEGALRPTRSNVLRDPYYRVRHTRNYFYQLYPHDQAIRERNCALVDMPLEDLALEPFWEDGRHLSAVMPLSELQERLMVPYAMIGHRDVRWFYAVRVWIDALLEANPDAEARVILMDAGRDDPAARVRERASEDGKLKQLPQGRDKTGFGTYPGDLRLFDEDRVTIQIHRLRVREGDREHEPVVAIGARMHGNLPATLVQPEVD